MCAWVDEPKCECLSIVFYFMFTFTYAYSILYFLTTILLLLLLLLLTLYHVYTCGTLGNLPQYYTQHIQDVSGWIRLADDGFGTIKVFVE